MRTLTSPLIASKNALESERPWAYLAQIDILSTPSPGVPLRVCNTADPVIFGGNTFQPFPFKVGTLEENAVGEIRRMSVTAANVDQSIQNLLELYWGPSTDPNWQVSVWIVDVTQPDQTPSSAADVYTVASVATDLVNATFDLRWEGVTLTRIYPIRRYTTSGGFPNLPLSRHLGVVH